MMTHDTDEAPSESAWNQCWNRRDLLQKALGMAAGCGVVTAMAPTAAYARLVLDEDSGDYVEVEDVDWQTAWKDRLDKASTMSQEEIFNAARGAGN